MKRFGTICAAIIGGAFGTYFGMILGILISYMVLDRFERPVMAVVVILLGLATCYGALRAATRWLPNVRSLNASLATLGLAVTAIASLIAFVALLGY